VCQPGRLLRQPDRFDAPERCRARGLDLSIGVEAVGAASYIWMECDSDETSSDGRGTALARFKFVNGGTPSVKKFFTGSNTITCATDPIHNRITVRRSEAARCATASIHWPLPPRATSARRWRTMNTATVKSTLVFREPEGMAIYRTTAGETRLFLGFGSRSSIDDVDRYANIFSKNVLVG
jgi:hypothetical protein